MHQLWKFIRCIRGWLLVSLSRHILLTRTIDAWTLVITDIIVVDFWSVYKAMVDRRVRLSTLSSTFIHESSWFLPILLICSPLFGYINHTNPGEQGAVGPACVRERETPGINLYGKNAQAIIRLKSEFSFMSGRYMTKNRTILSKF